MSNELPYRVRIIYFIQPVLGPLLFIPLLFILYSNDLPIALKNCHTILFADDTTIYTTGTDLLDIFTRTCINTDLDVLNDWFMANKLSTNPSKTKAILQGGPKKNQTETI